MGGIADADPLFMVLSTQAIWLEGPELAEIRMAAKRHGVVVSVGFIEGTVASLGCMRNSNLLIGADGARSRYNLTFREAGRSVNLRNCDYKIWAQSYSASWVWQSRTSLWPANRSVADPIR
jgi:hypothetical protein